jgi:hypothetical protein
MSVSEFMDFVYIDIKMSHTLSGCFSSEVKFLDGKKLFRVDGGLQLEDGHRFSPAPSLTPSKLLKSPKPMQCMKITVLSLIMRDGSTESFSI